jgi:hypothetical protein
MTVYQWADGYHPPKGISAEQVGQAIEALDNPTPEALYEATKGKDHVLHKHIWSEGDQVWATKARLGECRHIIAGTRAVYSVGGKTIKVKAVEFLRTNGESTWHHMDEIIAERSLHAAYLGEIKRLMQQAQQKLEAFQGLLSEQD